MPTQTSITCPNFRSSAGQAVRTEWVAPASMMVITFRSTSDHGSSLLSVIIRYCEAPLTCLINQVNRPLHDPNKFHMWFRGTKQLLQVWTSFGSSVNGHLSWLFKPSELFEDVSPATLVVPPVGILSDYNFLVSNTGCILSQSWATNWKVGWSTSDMGAIPPTTAHAIS